MSWLAKPSASTSVDKPSNPFVVEAGEADDLLTHPGVSTGGRRPTLCRLVGIHLARGDSPRSIEAMAKAWAGRCEPPLDEAEWLPHVVRLVAKEETKADAVPGKMTPPEHKTQDQPGGGVPDAGAGKEGSKKGSPQQPDADEPSLLPSFPAEPSVEPGLGVDEVSSEPASTDSPLSSPSALPPAALYGLLGEYVRQVAPKSEADPAGILLCLLAGAGSIVGRGLHHRIGRRHSANLFGLLLGSTSSRKGTCWGVADSLLSLADPDWSAKQTAHGFGSGQGLVYRLRDANGDDPGEADKRLLVIEEEFAKPLRLARQQDSTLSQMVRLGFDGSPLQVLNKGENGYGCREPHVSVLGMTTAEELRDNLKGRTEIANGFLNRFLLVGVKRCGFLPLGGDYPAVAERMAPDLAEALARAGGFTDAYGLEPAAEALWGTATRPGEYHRLEADKPGVYGQATARLSVHALKVAMLYAALDGCRVIAKCHLLAALALVDYADASAAQVFGGAVAGLSGSGFSAENAEPEPLGLQVLNALPCSRGDITSRFKARLDAAALSDILAKLSAKGLAFKRTVKTGGRSAEWWYPKGEADAGEDDTHHQDQDHKPPEPEPEPVRKEERKPEPSATAPSLFVVADEPSAGAGSGFVGVSSDPAQPTAERGLL